MRASDGSRAGAFVQNMEPIKIGVQACDRPTTYLDSLWQLPPSRSTFITASRPLEELCTRSVLCLDQLSEQPLAFRST